MRPLLLAALATLTVSLAAAPRHSVLLREATAAARAGDLPAALPKLEAAAQLRPDYPRVQLNLARVCAALQRPDDALAALERLAAMGFQFNAAADPGLASLKDSPRFDGLVARLVSGPVPVIASLETGPIIPEATGIIESVLFDPATGRWFFGDVHHRCIWVQRTAGAALEKFTDDDAALDGVFKLALSPDGQTLWAATATVGVMTGTDAEDGKRTALIALDPTTGQVRARFSTPADGRKHLLGDFILAPDGSLYAPDSVSPLVWRLPAGGTALEPWLESDDFLSLQGLAFDSAGTLYVADYANGIWRIDPTTKIASLLTAPANATFFGLDGLYAIPGGLLAVQNGVNPQRILEITFPLVGPSPGTTSPTVRILALGHSAMTDLALGQVIDGRFHFVANSGWSLFDPTPASPPAPRPVAILSLPLD